ncbi:MAG: protein-methionine-sulfoxide reductase catalytic subunit MsrP, partial [Rubricella sp.]
LNPAFSDAGRPVTDEGLSSTYNNFYEFGSSKRIWREAQALEVDPWTIAIDGMVERPFEIGFEDLMSRVTLEERIVRHRCVEAWSMVVPWIGFPLSQLLEIAQPLSSARYVRFETFLDPDVAREQRATWWPWPYVEGLTIEEAANELSFVVTGAYGKELHKQFGAPLRLHTPWKYGFKHIKSIVKITFTDEQPLSFWEELQAREYGFWANVNPDVDHPRWSQATELMLGEDDRRPTLLFNGYGEQVAHLYTGMEERLGDRLWR